MNKQDNTAPLGFTEKVGYGLGDMASNFYLGFFGLFLLYYYTDVYGLPPAAVGTMLLVTKIIDAISDPAMGLIADRTDSRWGKYRPYLLWAAIPYGLLGYVIFFGPELSETGRLVYAYITYTAVMLAYTAINVPYSALLAVISPLASERTKVTTYRFIFASLGGLLVSAFATPLTHYLGGGNELLGFRLTMALFAVLSIVLFWITFATTKERIKPAVQKTSAREDIKVLVRNSSWVALAVCCILLIVGLVARTASVIYYVKYFVVDDGNQSFLIFDRTALFATCGGLGQLAGVFFTQTLTDRLDKHRVILGMSLIHVSTLVTCYFIPADSFWTIVAFHALGMMTFGVTITVLFVMFTDCAEYGEWQTGKRTSGLTVSASMFALKFGSAVGGAIPGFMLAFYGFVANETQSAETIEGIRVMFNLLPALLFFSGGMTMFFYKIDRKTLNGIEADMLARR